MNKEEQEQEHIKNIAEAHEGVTKAFTHYVDGAITTPEFQAWVLALAYAINQYAVFEVLKSYNKE